MEVLVASGIALTGIFCATADDEVAERFKEKLRQNELTKQAEIDRCQTELESARITLDRFKRGIVRRVATTQVPGDVRKPVLFPSATAKRRAIEQAEIRLKLAVDTFNAVRDAPPSRPLLKESAPIGDVGYFSGNSVGIVEIIDADAMLVRLGGTMATVRGVSTKGLSDGGVFATDALFEIVGKEAYGSRTVLSLRQFDKSRLEATPR